MPTLSLVIPTYTLKPHLEQQAYTCALSYRDQVDELIITEDGGKYSKRLRDIADTYIYNKNNAGFTKNVNRGWKFASGDFVAIVNSDTFLMEGKLSDLCIPGKVTSPLIVNQYIDRLAGPFWVAPKEVTQELGYLLEPMIIYCSDSEYDQRVKNVFEKVDTVKIFHEMAQTVTEAGVEGGVQQAKDRKIYEQLIKEGKAVG